MPAPERLPGVPVPGDVIADKYRVEQLLGAGGMGAVVAATHLQLEEKVAIKILLPALAADPEIVSRFLREGRAAVRVRSEHVGRVLDVATVTPGGPPCIIMEYLEGEDLAGLVERRGKLPVRDAVEYVLQACEALAEAHVLGIVHRDLKPANLFLTRRADGSACIKVLDFGIAKVIPRGESAHMTKTHAQLGTPLYMAPEQLRSSRTVDLRADIWGLGVLLFELVTGEPPFKAESLPELAVIVATEPAPRLRDAHPEIPTALQAVLDRCLEKEPARRYATVADLAQALAAIAASDAARASAERITRIVSPKAPEAAVTQHAATVPPPPTPAAQAQGALTGGSWAKSPNEPSARPVLAAIAVVALAAVVGIVVFVRAQRPTAKPASELSTPATSSNEPAAAAAPLPSASAAPLDPPPRASASVAAVASTEATSPAPSQRRPPAATKPPPTTPASKPTAPAPKPTATATTHVEDIH